MKSQKSLNPDKRLFTRELISKGKCRKFDEPDHLNIVYS